MAHWTAKSISSYIFAVTSNFVITLENQLTRQKKKYKDLAKALNIPMAEVMYKIDNPQFLSLVECLKWARAAGMKFILVAYDDEDTDNERGPVNCELVRLAWELLGRPDTMTQLREAAKKYNIESKVLDDPDAGDR
jgi:hypothetical protein